MFEYALHKIRAAELIREAEAHRTARQVVLARRAARRTARSSGRDDTEGRVGTDPKRGGRAA